MRLIKDHDKPDALLQSFEEYLRSSGADFFQRGRIITVGRAPARIDCMGGIADYSGSVVILARADAHEAIGEIAAEYEAQTGLRPDIFDGTSPGAYAFGPREYRLEKDTSNE